MLPVVVIVGRPNVGKSTLFNRLTRTKNAIVDDQPGITRDRMHGIANFDGKDYLLVDTGGMAEGVDEIVNAEMKSPTIADSRTELSDPLPFPQFRRCISLSGEP